jgi:hypothetical protein
MGRSLEGSRLMGYPREGDLGSSMRPDKRRWAGPLRKMMAHYFTKGLRHEALVRLERQKLTQNMKTKDRVCTNAGTKWRMGKELKRFEGWHPHY